MRWAALALVLAGCAQAADPGVRPTSAGEVIGTATMAADRSIRLQLASRQCDGTIAHGDFVIAPTEPRHAEIVRHVGGIEPGQTRPVPAWPSPPCPAN